MGYVTKEEVECKSCGRTIQKKELQYDSPEGRICLECYKTKSHLPEYQLVLQTTPPREMARRKNPLVAAILNFFFPGVGFVYLETNLYVVAGTVLFVSSLVLVALPSTIAVLGPSHESELFLLFLFIGWFAWILIIGACLVAGVLSYFPILLILGVLWAFLGAKAADHVNTRTNTKHACMHERS